MTTVTLKQLGARLARLRKRASLTQAQVAERLGMTNETVSRLERGVQWTDFNTLNNLANLYGVELSGLMAVYPDDAEGTRRAAIRDVVEMLERMPDPEVMLVRDLLRLAHRQRSGEREAPEESESADG